MVLCGIEKHWISQELGTATKMTQSYFEYKMKTLAPTSYSGAKYFTTFNAKLVPIIKLLALKVMHYLLQIELRQMNKYRIQLAH